MIAWCGTDSSPMGNVSFPYWSKKPCDGNGGRMRLNLTVSTIAASIELSLLHSTATSLLSGDVPSCSDFDLSRWGLLEAAHAIMDPQAAQAASKQADDTRGRSRSPHRNAEHKAVAVAKHKALHGRSGLEPMVIKLLRAWYAKDWAACGGIADAIWWSRDNIQKQVR